jgi:hypothetical protein
MSDKEVQEMARARKQNQRVLEVALVAMLALTLIAGIMYASGGVLNDPSSNLLIALIWPSSLVTGALIFRELVGNFFLTLEERVREGSSVRIGFLEVGDSVASIPIPTDDEKITSANIALLHTSFYSRDGTQSMNDGQIYYQIEVVIVAPDSVMSRVTQVTYRLPEGWPKEDQVAISRDIQSRFKMKNLAYGTAIVIAEVEIEGQAKPVLLNRFIDLQRAGPRI